MDAYCVKCKAKPKLRSKEVTMKTEDQLLQEHVLNVELKFLRFNPKSSLGYLLNKFLHLIDFSYLIN